MIYIYDRLSDQFLYVNKNHITHASEWVGNKWVGNKWIGNKWIGTEIYKVYLTNGRKLLVDDYYFNKILKELREAKK